MKNLYLHIGFHKTGTSSIQEYLCENRELLSRRGYFYPESLDGKYPGNVDLSWVFNRNPPKWSDAGSKSYKEEVLSHYRGQISSRNADNLIISSEDFVLLDGQLSSIEEIGSFFSEYDVKVVCYVREPLDFMVSLYSHAVRARTVSCDFSEFIRDHYNFRAADFPIRIQPWVRVFGKDNVVVRKYDRTSFVGGSLINDFLHLIGFPEEFDAIKKDSNVGVHPWLIAPYLEVSKSDVDEASKQGALDGLLRLGRDLPKINSVEYLLSSEVREIVSKSYQVAKDRLRRDFGIEF